VSTEGQELEPQRLELLAYCQRQGLTYTVEFSDVISGTKSSRVGLDALMAAVRRKEIKTVVVVKLDRLGRSLSHLAGLMEDLMKHGVAFVATSQGIDTSKANPMAEMQIGLLSVFAQFERSLIVERTKAGLAAARARGVRLGKPSKVLPANWATVVAQWRSETGGTSIRDLAMRLNGVSLSTAFRLAKEGAVAA
jgi:DNA invertase Pin-like site-specific DNA recombinase